MTTHAFALWRIALGAYLLWFVVGRWVDVGLGPAPGGIPGGASGGLLSAAEPWAVRALLGAVGTLSVGLMAGWRRRWLAGLSLIGWAWWAEPPDLSALLRAPAVPLVGLALLFLAAVPSGEAWARDPARPDFRVPVWAHRGLLLLVMAGYTAHGLHRLAAPGDGGPLLAWGLRAWVRALPPGVLASLATAVQALEVLALPGTLYRPTRPLMWLLLGGMHLGLLPLVDGPGAQVGLLLVHALCWQREWWPPPDDVAGGPPTLFFDGVCNLCNGAVRFVLAEDVEGRFRFAPLQGETAAGLALPEVTNLSTLVLREGDRVYLRSDAVLRVGRGLGGIWAALARIARWVPRPVRDAAYGVVARHRYALFGRKDACRLPTPAERTRFLP